MKKTLLLMALLITNTLAGFGDSAGGSGKSLTWQQLKNNEKIIFDLPGHKFESFWLDITKICNEGNTIRSIEKLPIREQRWLGRRNDSYEYVTVGEEFKRAPLFNDQGKRILQDEYEIKVSKKRYTGSHRNTRNVSAGRKLFTKKAILKACEELESQD
ncbi:hypothetical protein HBN50_09120 [Halobacteriovorax sp. GB3]|uniref:hypothetical protein n=1 Tax=Halobacteriovorax sp. GB3 TaxID=2719615 RepID=UPI00235F2A5E|nr:hypothetical protein [Halobacteriovorax sp. GB3]MDD0853258.1 hypothetical protein [Halobacteriovorax sp. GB3]